MDGHVEGVKGQRREGQNQTLKEITDVTGKDEFWTLSLQNKLKGTYYLWEICSVFGRGQNVLGPSRAGG